MTATKGPIERIRDACQHAEACGVNPPVGESIEDILIACDELAAHERAYVERRPHVFMVTDAQDETIFSAIMECLGIIGHSEGHGAALEKISTEWMASKQTGTPQPDRIANGDGTVTFQSVPVTLPTAIVADGATVLRVGVPKPGEQYVLVDGTKSRICTDERWLATELRIILSAPPAPQFREGCYYRTRGGEVKGPIRRVETSESEYVLIDDHTGAKYTERGCRIGILGTDDDLRPGEITVWQPPASLAAREYLWDGMVLTVFSREDEGLGKAEAALFFSDWTDPPKPGRYKVPGGGKIATWEGDA